MNPTAIGKEIIELYGITEHPVDEADLRNLLDKFRTAVRKEVAEERIRKEAPDRLL